MAELRRAGKPTLHYALDDYTDPWRHAPYLLLQHHSPTKFSILHPSTTG